MANKILYFFCDNIMPWIMIAAIVFAFIFLPYVGYQLYQKSKSPTFTLIKDEWECREKYRYPVTIYVKSGSIMVPIVTQHEDCILWGKR